MRDRHRGRFRQRRRAIVEGGIGDVEAGQQRDHGLKLVGRLQGALASLGLVGRVRGVEIRPGDDLVDDRRTEPPRCPGTEEAVRGRNPHVEAAQLAEVLDELHLGERLGKLDSVEPQRSRQVLAHPVGAVELQGLQHLGAFGVGVREVSHEPDWPCTNASYAFWSSNLALSFTSRSLITHPLPYGSWLTYSG